jgi:hypothetical protein
MGNFGNNGREWRPKDSPKRSTFTTSWTKAALQQCRTASMTSTTTSDGSASARITIPKGSQFIRSADGGGSDGYRVRLSKVELQKLADGLKVPITVRHMPPGTSKWNKVEHRLISFISINWRGYAPIAPSSG